MDWQPPQKPAEIAESRLLEAILSGRFPINSNLPAERELAVQIGVTRPTLREVLQRMARDGWLDIQHGKPTRVRDYWREGNLGVLAALAQSPAQHLPDFLAYLLELRILLAPAYARQAIEQDPAAVVALLADSAGLPDDPSAFARLDWSLHIGLTRLARNPVFQLLYNGFHDLSLLMGEHYFASPEGRQSSRLFYAALLDCARRGDAAGAEGLVRRVMEESLALQMKMQKKNA